MLEAHTAHQPTLLVVLAHCGNSCGVRALLPGAHTVLTLQCVVSAPTAADANSGYERLAVVGEDSARQDRRYTYKALDDVGGFYFENGKAVSRKSDPDPGCWLRNQ